MKNGERLAAACGCFLLLVSIALPLLSPASAVAASPDGGFLTPLGGSVFPPENLSAEDVASELAAWLGAALGTGRLAETSAGTARASFIDAFNHTLDYLANTYVFADQFGTELRLRYANGSAEFIGFELVFGVPRPLAEAILENEALSVATALGVSLNNTTYGEFMLTYGEPDANGTLPTQRYGWIRHAREFPQVSFANQLRLVEDANLHALLEIRGFRWLTTLPNVAFTADQIVRASSELVNESFGEKGTLFAYAIAIAPNYQNLTVSLFVELNYIYAEGGGTAYSLYLDPQTLEFQYLIGRTSVVPSTGPSRLLFWLLIPAAALFLALALFAGVSWFTGIEAPGALALISALVPFYTRLKRESVLDHFLRGRIVEYLSHNPGCTFSTLRNRFDVANGVLTHHLWVLSKLGFVQTAREGPRTLYYVAGAGHNGVTSLSAFQESLLRLVRGNGEMSLRDLAHETRSSKQRIHYNVRHLARMELVDTGKHDGVRTVSMAEGGVNLLDRIDRVAPLDS